MRYYFLAMSLSSAACGQIQFIDATEQVGLLGQPATRVVLVDLNGDTRPDVVVDRSRVFLNQSTDQAPGVRFIEVASTGLPLVNAGDCLVFADLNNDGHADAIVTRNVTDTTDPVLPTAWFPGNGDGTFGDEHPIVAAAPKTTACIAVGDVNDDGLLDLYLGNWYTKYGESVEAFANDLLIQTSADAGAVGFRREPLPEDEHPFTEDEDLGGRPTYGAMIVKGIADDDFADGKTSILELNYGRRWNRLWRHSVSDLTGGAWENDAASYGLDGDQIRHGRYPEWLKERARTDARFNRDDEKPFRSNGNTFDAAIGDADADGYFDVLIATIAHGWAGESSDRSRLLLYKTENKPDPNALTQPTSTKDRQVVVPTERSTFFEPSSQLLLDRIPPDPLIRNWNQGDLFCEMADFDLDGRLDVLLSSGDYPDNQRLRVWRHMPDGSFVNVTDWSGLNNDGSQQITLGDIDLDGDIDLLVGQSFNRMPKAQRETRTPALKVYLNQAIERQTGNGLVLILEGDHEQGVNRDALGAIVQVEADLDGMGPGDSVKLLRQLIGIGGHAGKEHAFELAFGIGGATRANRVTIWWPGSDEPTVVEGLDAGRHVIRHIER